MFRNLKGWCCMLNLLWHILRQWVGILLWKVVCGFFCLLVISWWGVEIEYQRIGLVEVNLQRVGLIEVKRQRVGCLGCGLFVLLVKNPLRQSVLLSLHSPSPPPPSLWFCCCQTYSNCTHALFCVALWIFLCITLLRFIPAAVELSMLVWISYETADWTQLASEIFTYNYDELPLINER